MRPGELRAAEWSEFDLPNAEWRVPGRAHERWEEAGLRVAARGPRNEMRAFDLPGKRFFLATLFQPQLSSTGEQPHPLVLGYLRACAEFRATKKAAMARSV